MEFNSSDEDEVMLIPVDMTSQTFENNNALENVRVMMPEHNNNNINKSNCKRKLSINQQATPRTPNTNNCANYAENNSVNSSFFCEYNSRHNTSSSSSSTTIAAFPRLLSLPHQIEETVYGNKRKRTLTVEQKNINKQRRAIAKTKISAEQTVRNATLHRTHQATYLSRRIKTKRVQQEWDYENLCVYCGCLWLRSNDKFQRFKCCLNGAAITSNIFPKLFILPDTLKCLALERGRHIGKNSAQYNNMLSIAGIGVKNSKIEKGFEKILGDSCVRVNGRVYSFLPKAETNNKMQGGLAYYTFDSHEGLMNHADFLNNKNNNKNSSGNDQSSSDEHQRINKQFLLEIYNEFKQINPFAIQLRSFGDRFQNIFCERSADGSLIVNPVMLLNQENLSSDVRYKRLKHSMNAASSIFQVGGIVSDTNSGNITIDYKLHENDSSFVDGTSRLVEPLCYPLLFPYGEKGWGQELRKDISFLDYMSCRLLMPEQTYNNGATIDNVMANLTLYEYHDKDKTTLSKMNSSGTRRLNTNRFQLFTRLSSYYVVEEMCRAIDYTLAWHRDKKNQNFIFGKSDNSTLHDDSYYDNNLDNGDVSDDEDGSFEQDMPAEDDDRKKDEQTYLADSFFGSPRHLKRMALNAMTVVSEVGRQTLFITLTCNVRWPEIQERMFDSQSAFEREEIVCIVFKARLAALLFNLRNGKYFGGGKVEWIIHVIEYQHRGLPHAHIACRLSNAPNHKDNDETCAWIDNHVCAEMPIVTPASSTRDVEYEKLVRLNMVHKCAPIHAVNGCINKETLMCKYSYEENSTNAITYLDGKGYPIYRRRNERDSMVVPHNRELLLDWDGHANVEFAGSTYSVLYLFKYLHKGNKKVKVGLMTDPDPNEEENKEDEISLYLKGRMICSMEATWRIMGYQTYPKSYPSVRVIKPKLGQHSDIIHSEGKVCDMLIYFKRPPHEDLDNLKYTEFFTTYDYSYTLPSRCNNNNANNKYFRINLAGVNKPIYVYKRVKPADSIVRMTHVFLSAGEIWYFRVLLLHFPFKSYDDAKTFEGIQYSSYQTAAIARGLFAVDGECRVAFAEAMLISTPPELRNMLILMSLQGFPTLSIFEDKDMHFALLEDIYHRNNMNLEQSSIILLNEIHTRFRDEDKDALHYGFPPCQGIMTELEQEKLKYNHMQQAAQLAELQNESPNTEEQQHVYDEICGDLLTIKHTSALFEGVNGGNVSSIECKFYFLQGQAGCGKSTFAKKLLAFTRSQGLIAKGCSSTGLSCQVYKDFSTAHTLFGIPVSEDEEDYDHDASIVSTIKSERRELLAKTSLIIWDEFLSNHKQCLHCAYDVTDRFTNKVVVCMGDYRQIAPVVLHGTIEDIVKASPLSSHLWSKFKVRVFTKNMRLRGLGDIHVDVDETLITPEELMVHKSRVAKGKRQSEYAKMLLEVGEGNLFSQRVQPLVEEPESGSTLVRLPLIKHITDQADALNFIYPNGFDTATMYKSSILAATNEDGDVWNALVQEMNPNAPKELLSSDVFDEIDDPHGFIQEMLTVEALNKFNKNGCPQHKLTLKVGDICIILRNLSKKEGLTNNTRVRISHIGKFSVRVQTLDDVPKSFNIPRIRFRFRLPFGSTFYMTRTQYPFRLAYCMTYNKAQRQEWDKVLADIRKSPFTHGHLYVVQSRIRDSDNIMMYCNDNQILANAPCVTNVVYNKLKIQMDR